MKTVVVLLLTFLPLLPFAFAEQTNVLNEVKITATSGSPISTSFGTSAYLQIPALSHNLKFYNGLGEEASIECFTGTAGAPPSNSSIHQTYLPTGASGIIPLLRMGDYCHYRVTDGSSATSGVLTIAGF